LIGDWHRVDRNMFGWMIGWIRCQSLYCVILPNAQVHWLPQNSNYLQIVNLVESQVKVYDVIFTFGQSFANFLVIEVCAVEIDLCSFRISSTFFFKSIVWSVHMFICTDKWTIWQIFTHIQQLCLFGVNIVGFFS